MLIASFTAILLAAAAPEMMIPPGTILPVILNETLNTAKVQDNDPVLFSLADDVRAGGHRGPVLIPRGSNVVGRVLRSQRAGHFIGRSQMDIGIEEIITPAGDVYDGVSARIIDVGKRKGEKGEVKADGGIQGPVHRTRDTFLLLFPPTTTQPDISGARRHQALEKDVSDPRTLRLCSPARLGCERNARPVPPPERGPRRPLVRPSRKGPFPDLNQHRSPWFPRRPSVWKRWWPRLHFTPTRFFATCSRRVRIRSRSCRRTSGSIKFVIWKAACRAMGTTMVGIPA